MTTTAIVDRARALEAIGQAGWHLDRAYVALVPVLHCALYVEGAEPEVLSEALLATIRETQALEARFTEESGK